MFTRHAIARAAGLLCFVIAGMIAGPSPLSAQKETVLYDFCAQNLCADGNEPQSVLLIDHQGNLYGTTFFGGAHRDGEVYRVSSDGTETVLYSFGGRTGEGVFPVGGVVADQAGNLYGVTSAGGAYDGGVVYRLSRSGVETNLYNFAYSGTYNPYPQGDLFLDADGNLYGTTGAGGANHAGMVYELTPNGTVITLYTFGASPTDGSDPNGGLIMDAEGNLYGTTREGGEYGNGTVFVVNPDGTEQTLHSFDKSNGADGSWPDGGLIMDEQGNLYGVTLNGGSTGGGIAFSISPSGTETILHTFGGGPTDAAGPGGKLLMDAQGNLYGTTSAGGPFNQGTVYTLQPFSILHIFGGSGDGAYPVAGLAMGTNGNLFGTTYTGGSKHLGGTVFEIAP